MLSWESAQAWPSYTVNVLTSDLEPVWSASGITVLQIKVPAEALESVDSHSELNPEAERTLLWQVEAWQDGVRRQMSPMFRVNLLEGQQ